MIVREEIIGDCRMILGNSYDIIPTLCFFDCMCTDPPYEFESSGGGIFRRDRQNMDEIQAAGLDKGFDKTILCPMFRFNSCVVFCHNDQLPEIINYIAGNYNRFAVCAYHKTNPMPVANKHYLPDTEFYIHAWNKGGHPVGDLADKKRYYIGKNGQDKSIAHPTVKPLPLMEKIIKNINGNLIVDPFAGSGTTGIACMNLGKRFIGIEKNEKFFNIAVDRIRKHHNELQEKKKPQ